MGGQERWIAKPSYFALAQPQPCGSSGSFLGYSNVECLALAAHRMLNEARIPEMASTSYRIDRRQNRPTSCLSPLAYYTCFFA